MKIVYLRIASTITHSSLSTAVGEGDEGPETMLNSVLAHQGGWDEIGMVLLPLLAIAGVLYGLDRWAKSRARQTHEVE